MKIAITEVATVATEVVKRGEVGTTMMKTKDTLLNMSKMESKLTVVVLSKNRRLLLSPNQPWLHL